MAVSRITSSIVIGSIGLAIAVVALILGSIAVARPYAVRRFNNSGTCTWTIDAGGSPLDTQTGTYRLYDVSNDGHSYGLLELDPPAAALDAGLSVTPAAAINIKIQAFDPPVVPLGPLGNWEYMFPLNYHSLNETLTIDTACYAEDSCYESTGGGRITRGGIVVFSDDDVGYLQFSVETYNASTIDWSSTTVNLSSRWTLTLPNY